MNDIRGQSFWPARWQRRAATTAALAMLLLAAGCADPKELTRERVRRLIDESDGFRFSYVQLKDEPTRIVQTLSADETEERVVARTLDFYFMNSDAYAVLRHTGFIDARAVVTSKSSDGWRLRIEPYLTEKGKALAREYGVIWDRTLPLAKKHVVEVTGITAQGVHAMADFTWRAEPTEAGQAFDVRTRAFGELPQRVQAEVRKRAGGAPKVGVVEWEAVRAGARASLQLFDDGWRLRGVL